MIPTPPLPASKQPQRLLLALLSDTHTHVKAPDLRYLTFFYGGLLFILYGGRHSFDHKIFLRRGDKRKQGKQQLQDPVSESSNGLYDVQPHITRHHGSWTDGRPCFAYTISRGCATIKLIKVPIKCSLFFGKYCNKQKIDLSDVSTKNFCEPRTQDDGVK